MAKTMASLQAFPSSLLPRAWSRALIPFPFRTPATQASQNMIPRERLLVCYTAVFRVVTQSSSPLEALSDDTKNGCVAD